MFTGIINGTGRISAITPLGKSALHGKRLSIICPSEYLVDVALGDSIAINGACMTVTSLDVSQNCFTVDVSVQSLDKTAGLNHPGPVNLEKALRANDRLGGHLVSGHIDGVGEVMQFAQISESWNLQILAPKQLAKYLAYKGSITVNGVSLTINQIKDVTSGCEIHINLIPHTVQSTTLHALESGTPVNLEVDLIARYCERMLSHENTA